EPKSVTRYFWRVVRRNRVNSLTTSHSPVTARSRSSIAASSSLRRTMSDCPKDDFCLLMLGLELREVQHGTPPRSGLAMEIRSCVRKGVDYTLPPAGSVGCRE